MLSMLSPRNIENKMSPKVIRSCAKKPLSIEFLFGCDNSTLEISYMNWTTQRYYNFNKLEPIFYIASTLCLKNNEPTLKRQKCVYRIFARKISCHHYTTYVRSRRHCRPNDGRKLYMRKYNKRIFAVFYV